MTRAAIASGGKKGENSKASWAKVKYDRQIVAIAKVAQATAIYSDDDDVKSIGKSVGIPVISFAELPLPPEAAQKELPLAAPVEPLLVDPNDRSKMNLSRKSKPQSRRPANSADDKEQSKLFIEKAREIEADEKRSAADKLMERLAKMKPVPRKTSEK